MIYQVNRQYSGVLRRVCIIWSAGGVRESENWKCNLSSEDWSMDCIKARSLESHVQSSRTTMFIGNKQGNHSFGSAKVHNRTAKKFDGSWYYQLFSMFRHNICIRLGISIKLNVQYQQKCHKSWKEEQPKYDSFRITMIEQYTEQLKYMQVLCFMNSC